VRGRQGGETGAPSREKILCIYVVFGAGAAMPCRHVNVTFSLELETVELLEQLQEMRGKPWKKSHYVNSLLSRALTRDLRRAREEGE